MKIVFNSIVIVSFALMLMNDAFGMRFSGYNQRQAGQPNQLTAQQEAAAVAAQQQALALVQQQRDAEQRRQREDAARSRTERERLQRERDAEQKRQAKLDRRGETKTARTTTNTQANPGAATQPNTQIHGYVNTENRCYMHATLQCLFQIRSLRNAILAARRERSAVVGAA